MIITILAEPRSGSTNFTNWFYFNKNFTILFEPITSPKWKWYKHGTPPKLWEYKTPHLLNVNKTNNWDKVWVFKEDLIKNEDESYFNQIKNGIKEKYLNQNYFSISYEELYYNNGFQKVLDYLNMDELENKNFPYGQKYRIDDNKPKSLI